CLLTVAVEIAALSRADIAEQDRRQAHLIIDEFSMFSAQSEEALSRILSLCRKYRLYLMLAHQTWSQVDDRLKGALQNAAHIAFKLGRDDAIWAAPRFGQYDPQLVKHIVDDPNAAGRSHPIFASVQEQNEGRAAELEALTPRHAYVNVDGRTTKI